MQFISGLKSDLVFLKNKIFSSNPVYAAILFYLTAMILDWISTILCMHAHIPGLHESNPFVRNAQMNFVWHKAAIVDLFYFLTYGALAGLLYKVFSVINTSYGRIAASLVFIYNGIDRILNAVLENFFYAFHFYQASPKESIIDLFLNAVRHF